MKECWIDKIRGESVTDCTEEKCSLWNEKRNECSAKSFLSSWLELSLATLKMQTLYERLNSEEENT